MFARWLIPALAISAVIPQISHANDLDLVLRLKARVSMEKLAHEVTDPRSPRYRRYFTPDEIRELAAPSDADYENLIRALKSQGFTLVAQSRSHLFLTVRASQRVLEKTFAVHIQMLRDGLHRVSGAPRIPGDLGSIVSVIGLDNTRKSRPAIRVQPVAVPSGDTGAGLQPAFIKSAYGFDPIYQTGLSGAGQDIAIATYDGYYPQVIQQYYAFQKIQPVPQVDTVEFNGHAAVNDNSAMETAVDAEFSGMIAPGAKIHVFTSAKNSDAGEVQLFTAILDDNRAKVVNYSWGDCEADVSPQHFKDMNAVFARAVAQGINVMVASGDSGAYGCPLRGTPGQLNADWPAADPYVVAVGGTHVTGGQNDNVQESAWSSGGGGISSVFPLPNWQRGLGAPYLKRSFPDVAFNADPGSGEPAYLNYMGEPQWVQIGGTSIAAPQWTGFMALVGAARTGLPSLGYLNPIIYGMSPAQRAQDFHDVVTGNNGGYSAGPGWDATTGWGSMRASSLLKFLRSH